MVKEQSAALCACFLPIFLPIAQASGGGQLGLVIPRPATVKAVAERSDSIRDWVQGLD